MGPLPLTCLALFNFSLQMSTTAGQTRMTVLQQWQTWLIIIIITFAKVLQIFGKPININQLQLKAPPHTHRHTHSVRESHKSRACKDIYEWRTSTRFESPAIFMQFAIRQTNLPNRPQAKTKTRPRQLAVAAREHGQKSSALSAVTGN